MAVPDNFLPRVRLMVQRGEPRKQRITADQPESVEKQAAANRIDPRLPLRGIREMVDRGDLMVLNEPARVIQQKKWIVAKDWAKAAQQCIPNDNRGEDGKPTLLQPANLATALSKG